MVVFLYSMERHSKFWRMCERNHLWPLVFSKGWHWKRCMCYGSGSLPLICVWCWEEYIKSWCGTVCFSLEVKCHGKFVDVILKCHGIWVGKRSTMMIPIWKFMVNLECGCGVYNLAIGSVISIEVRDQIGRHWDNNCFNYVLEAFIF